MVTFFLFFQSGRVDAMLGKGQLVGRKEGQDVHVPGAEEGGVGDWRGEGGGVGREEGEGVAGHGGRRMRGNRTRT